MEHLKTLLSSHATKAWIAGLAVVISAYLIPILEKWFATVTPEQVSGWLGGLPLAMAAALLGLVSVVWVYAVRNNPPDEIRTMTKPPTAPMASPPPGKKK